MRSVPLISTVAQLGAETPKALETVSTVCHRLQEAVEKRLIVRPGYRHRAEATVLMRGVATGVKYPG
jgi:hypothetical protein